MYQNILVTLDGSPLAEQALPHAVELAKKFDANLHIVRVVVPIALIAPTPTEYDISETYRRACLREAHDYLQNFNIKYGGELKNPIHVQVLEGVVVDCVLEYADEQHIDMIVMATHGRSGIGRWFYGSVAERVLRAARVPVALIRAQEIPVTVPS
jgi:nucleotide-binding universal stress UspA family protein